MKYWLLKSEPESYSIDDLERDKKTAWEGVRNFQARNFMKAMQVDDRVIFYHSSTKSPAAVGEGSVCSDPYPDKTQFNSKCKYYDVRASKDRPIWMHVDICYVATFKSEVTLKAIKANDRFEDMELIRPGSRLSVQSLSKKHFDLLVKLGEADRNNS